MVFRSSRMEDEERLLARMVAVGRVTATTVRLWARTDWSGPVDVELDGGGENRRLRFSPTFRDGADGTFAFTYPDDLPGERPLAPLTRYRFRLAAADGSVIGEGKFETAPARPEDAPDKWSLAFISCHQPFDRKGKVSQRALAMLAAVESSLAEHDAKLVLFIGDQIYSDEPPVHAIVRQDQGPPQPPDGDPQQLRARYHRQYRRFWNLAPLQRIHARHATACIPDDHEIVNNWGSLAEHADPRWQRLRDAALEACYDYQGSRSFLRGDAPLAFDQVIEWGNAALYMMDARSHRWRDGDRGEVIGEDGIRAVEEFLARSAHLDAVFVVVPVPLVHIPDWLTSVSDTANVLDGEVDDRWSHPRNVAARDRLLGVLGAHRHAHPRQRVALLSGDIHAGWATGLYDDPAACHDPNRTALFHQFVSSAVSNEDSSLVGALSKALLRITAPLLGAVGSYLVGPLVGNGEHGENPFGGLNVGLVEIERSGTGGSTIRFKLLSHDEEEWSRPRVVFDSGRL